jgi:hypothetical protein
LWIVSVLEICIDKELIVKADTFTEHNSEDGLRKAKAEPFKMQAVWKIDGKNKGLQTKQGGKQARQEGARGMTSHVQR